MNGCLTQSKIRRKFPDAFFMPLSLRGCCRCKDDFAQSLGDRLCMSEKNKCRWKKGAFVKNLPGLKLCCNTFILRCLQTLGTTCNQNYLAKQITRVIVFCRNWLMQGLNEGGTMPRAVKSPNNVANTFFNTCTFTPKRPQVRTWRRQTCFLPRAPSKLVTPLDLCHSVTGEMFLLSFQLLCRIPMCILLAQKKAWSTNVPVHTTNSS